MKAVQLLGKWFLGFFRRLMVSMVLQFVRSSRLTWSSSWISLAASKRETMTS